MKKLEIEKTKPTFIISVLKVDIIKVGLVFSISNFFITKMPLANNWRRKKYLPAVIQLYHNSYSNIGSLLQYWVAKVIWMEGKNCKMDMAKMRDDWYSKSIIELRFEDAMKNQTQSIMHRSQKGPFNTFSKNIFQKGFL